VDGEVAVEELPPAVVVVVTEVEFGDTVVDVDVVVLGAVTT
jgi:hypothetical protein